MTSGILSFNATNSAQRITSLDYPFSTITFWGYSSFSTGIPISNSQSCYVGTSSDKLPIKVQAGSSYSITFPAGVRDNVENYYVAGTSGDGMVFFAW